MKRTLPLALTLFLLTALTVAAGTFVSFNGKFYITYPDTWQQIDYRTADYYLSQGRAEGEQPIYEAVFADRQSYSIFAGQYLILTVDTVGALHNQEIDSVLDVMKGEFGRDVVILPPDSFLVEWDTSHIFYDSAHHTTAVVSQLTGDETGPRLNLMSMQFYSHGIANFFFYSPAAEFEPALPLYKGIIMSLSTENLDQVLRNEEVKVAKVGSPGNTWKYLALVGGLIIILLVVILAFRKKTDGRSA